MSMSFQTTYNTAPAIGYSGLLEGNDDASILPMKNVEASASMPFGTGVKFKTSSPASDLDALIPTTSSDLIAGILVHSNAYSRAWTAADGTVYGELDSTGLRPNTFLNVLRKGRILVTCPTGCAPGDRLWVRCTAGLTFTAVGACENVVDAGTAGFSIDCTKQGQWLSTATAGNLAWLEVDFTNKP